MTAAPRILILGGASAIARAYARLRVTTGARFVLAGRNEQRLTTVAADLIIRGAASAEILVVDFSDLSAVARIATEIRARFGEPDEILVAYGALGDQIPAERDIVQARNVLETNFVSPALFLLALLAERDSTKPLQVVVIGSVAGDRARAANFIYGSAKGGLEIFVEGLRHKFRNRTVRFTFVKPGFVDTPMTAAFPKRGPLWASPETAANAIAQAVTNEKRVVYVPCFWGPIMLVIRNLPWSLFKRFNF